MSADELDPLRLSRELERVHHGYGAFVPAAKRAGSASDPFRGGLFPGKVQYDLTLELPPDDALRAPLQRHLHALIRARVQLPWTNALLWATAGEPHTITEPEKAEVTLSEVRMRAQKVGGDRPAWARARDSMAAQLLPAYQEYWQRQPEIDRRLGANGAALEPWDDRAELLACALNIVRCSDEGLTHLGYLSEIRFQDLALKDASDGWPARLKVSSLVGTLGQKGWFRDVRLGSLVLPERRNPASFLRAYASLGLVIGQGLVRRDLPFVVARSPFDEKPLRLGVELALVASSRAFQVRRLGLARQRAQLAERALGVLLLLELRRRAVRFVLTEAAIAGQDAVLEAAPWACRALGRGEADARGLLGNLYRPEPSGVDLFAFVDALRMSSSYRQEFAEDWFDDPRALDALRAEAELPLSLPTPVAPLRTAAEAWVSDIIQSL